jgi:hypothetical protein
MSREKIAQQKFRPKSRLLAVFTVIALVIGIFQTLPPEGTTVSAANPILPLWERIPDGEPRVFTDPATGEDRIYVYGSHDSRLSGYCGPDHVVWSAPVNAPNNWRQEGTAFHVNQLNGVQYKDSDGIWKQLIVDVGPIAAFTDQYGVNHQGSAGANQRVALYAPDVVYNPDNNKYYMYLFVDGMWHVNPQAAPGSVPQQRRQPMFVAESSSPAGPFTNPKFVTLAFDPAVLVDTDNKNAQGKSRVFLYWTPEESRNLYAAELNPTDMATILPGTQHYPLGDTANSPNNTMPDWDAPFYMFEGSSIRKVGDKYLMAYCMGRDRTAYNISSNISEIGWAYSDDPFGPWTYGGAVVSTKGERIVNPYTDAANTETYIGGNIHGGMVEVNGQWYQFFHRSTNIDSKRQAMVEPFDISFDDSGNPVIEQVELTSQGFETDGLDPFKEQYASYACYVLPATGTTAPRFFSQNNNSSINFDPNAERDDWYPVQNLRNRSWLGYKYFNFGEGVETDENNKLKLVLTLKECLAGTVNIYASNPKETFSDPEQPKTLIGTIELKGNYESGTDGSGSEIQIPTISAIRTVEGYVDASGLAGKKGIYLEFLSDEGATSEVCQVNRLQFIKEVSVPVTDPGDNPGPNPNPNPNENVTITKDATGRPILSGEPSVAKPLDIANFVDGKSLTLANKTWTGKQIKSGLVVTVSYVVNGNAVTKSLTAGADYIVANYGKNKNIGKGTATLKGTGAFNGTINATFKIVPKKPAKLKLTAGKKSIKVAFNRVSKAQKIATYKVQYRLKSATKWTSKTVRVKLTGAAGKKKTASITIKGLKSGKQYRVVVYAYKGAYKGLPTSAKKVKVK